MNPAVLSHSSPQAPESLRERKKRLTREAIFAAAQALFNERGFSDVTVAEIADEANISVKTLFTYIGAKEELLFSGRPAVLDAVVEAVGNRRLGQTPLVAAGQALLAAVDDDDPDRNLDAFLRMAASGPAARSRLRALWDETEDALTEALAARRDGPRELAVRRLTAAQIMVLVRTVTSAEVGELIAKAAGAGLEREPAGAPLSLAQERRPGNEGQASWEGQGLRARSGEQGKQSPGRPEAGAANAARGQAEREALKDWIRDAAGQLARGLQAAGR